MVLRMESLIQSFVLFAGWESIKMHQSKPCIDKWRRKRGDIIAPDRNRHVLINRYVDINQVRTSCT